MVLVTQAVTDVASNLIKNDLNISEWEFSNWQTYVRAGLGGAIGGALTPFLGPVATAAIIGAVTSFIGMGLEKVTGAANYTLGEILWTTVLNGTVSGLTTGLFDKIKIPKITSGKGSLTAIQK